MNVIVIVAIAWLVVALAIALVIGRGIRIADQRATCCPLHSGGAL